MRGTTQYFLCTLVNTHVHADHVTGTGKLKERIPGFKSILSKASGGKADILVEDGEVITFGKQVFT